MHCVHLLPSEFLCQVPLNVSLEERDGVKQCVRMLVGMGEEDVVYLCIQVSGFFDLRIVSPLDPE